MRPSTGVYVGDVDWMGAEGGRLAAAFATGCVATWGFLQAFFWRGIRKSYEARIVNLEDDKAMCHERTLRLETMLWMHGPQQMRNDLQASISEQHVEMWRMIQAERTGKEGKA